MSEPKKVTFTTISTASTSSLRFGNDFLNTKPTTTSPSAGSLTAGIEKKEDDNKTHRLSLELFPTDTSKFPEFNYARLMRLEKKKQKKLKQKSNGRSDPFEENDDDVARIAKELEEKYGTAYKSGRARSSKRDDFCDIGMGYDDNDSFIDNTEAYDEMIPDEVETVEGGFYINCGALEFKQLQSETIKLKTDEIIKMPTKSRKRILSTSSEESSSSNDQERATENDNDEDDEEAEGDGDEEDDEDEEEDDEDDESSSGESSETTETTTTTTTTTTITTATAKHKKSSNGNHHLQTEKKPKSDATTVNNGASTSSTAASSNAVAPPPAKKAKKSNKDKEKPMAAGSLSFSSSNSPKPMLDEVGSDSDKERSKQKTVKTTTVKDVLKAKRDSYLKMQITSNEVRMMTNGEVKGAVSKSSADEESSEESVLNGGGSVAADTDSNHSSSSKDKKSKKANNGTTDENSENLRSSDTILPDLETEVLKTVHEFRETIVTKNLTGKRFHFDDGLTETFLRIDESLMCVDKNQRNMVFAHLEFHLLLPKYYFLRKSKQLRVKNEKAKIQRTLDKLRKAVNETMPAVTANYEIELRKYAEMASSNLDSDSPPKMPRKKFPWNSELRSLLYDVYQARWTSYVVLCTKKESLEDFISSFLKDKVVEIWPAGWMRFEELQKEIDKRKQSVKKKEKKAAAAAAAAAGNPTAANESNTQTENNNQAANSNITTASITASTTNSTILQPALSLPKHFEEYASSRSCANSDSESVASSTASTGTNKRKSAPSNSDGSTNRSNAKQHKSSKKAAIEQKINVAAEQSLQNIMANPAVSIQPIMTIANNSNAPTALSNGGMMTDKHSNSSLNKTNATQSPVALAAPGISATAAQKLQPSAAHIIDLDKYTSASDILEKSKQLQKSSNIPSNFTGDPRADLLKMATLKATRSDSSSDDGVEIVGVFPAAGNVVLPPKNNSNSNANGKKHKNSNKHSNNNYNNNNNKKAATNNSNEVISDLDVKGVVNSLKDLERIQKTDKSKALSTLNQ